MKNRATNYSSKLISNEIEAIPARHVGTGGASGDKAQDGLAGFWVGSGGFSGLVWFSEFNYFFKNFVGWATDFCMSVGPV